MHHVRCRACASCHEEGSCGFGIYVRCLPPLQEPRPQDLWPQGLQDTPPMLWPPEGGGLYRAAMQGKP